MKKFKIQKKIDINAKGSTVNKTYPPLNKLSLKRISM